MDDYDNQPQEDSAKTESETIQGDNNPPVKEKNTTHQTDRKKPKPKFARKLFLGCVSLVIIILVSAASSLGVSVWYSNHHKSTDVSSQRLVVSKNDNLIASIARELSPSVVSITTKQLGPQDLFGQQSVQEGAGSGIIVSADGLVLTNKHVVPSGVTSVQVILSDGTTKNASVVARDPLNDIALVKIDGAHHLKSAKLGDSSSMKVGDSVVAIGNALGQYQNTVTTGIISGLGRPVTAQSDDGSSSETLQDLFQTDAAINPGNSGGPLVNINGEVIGVNTAVASDAQNIGFALPINEVKASIESYQKTGKIIQPYLGVSYIPLTPDVAKQLSVNVSYGAYIGGNKQMAVISGSPADKAGVKTGDIITKVDNAKIDAGHSLTTLISQHRVGDDVNLTILRDGKTVNLTAKLAQAPSDLSQ